jgi:hypothetical protein
MYQPQQTPHQRLLNDEQNRCTGSIALTTQPAAPSTQWAMMLALWPPDLDGLAEAVPIAADYCIPGSLHVQVGQLDPQEPGDFDNDGFNESAGHYAVALQDGIARFQIDGTQQLRFYPTFRIHGSAAKQCWAYADGKLLAATWRDSEGLALVRLDRIVDKLTTVEIVTAP